MSEILSYLVHFVLIKQLKVKCPSVWKQLKVKCPSGWLLVWCRNGVEWGIVDVEELLHRNGGREDAAR